MWKMCQCPHGYCIQLLCMMNVVVEHQWVCSLWISGSMLSQALSSTMGLIMCFQSLLACSSWDIFNIQKERLFWAKASSYLSSLPLQCSLSAQMNCGSISRVPQWPSLRSSTAGQEKETTGEVGWELCANNILCLWKNESS